MARWSTGRMAKAYDREIPKRQKGKPREKAMIPKPEDRWLRRDAPALRIIDPDVAARVDARRLDRRTRYVASVVRAAERRKRRTGSIS